MDRRTLALGAGLAVALACALLFGTLRQAPSALHTSDPPSAQSREPSTAPLPPEPVADPSQPSPQPPAALPPPVPLSLPMTDGNPLRARWYPSKGPHTPVVVLDVGTAPQPDLWQAVLGALLAQRPAHVLWLDDAQPRHPDPVARQHRAIARWQAALGDLAVRAPGVRYVLVGVGDAGAAVWPVASQPLPLSVACLWPDAEPAPLDPSATPRFGLVLLPEPPTPTWAHGLTNARVQFAAARAAPELVADLAGWLFAALGPR